MHIVQTALAFVGASAALAAAAPVEGKSGAETSTKDVELSGRLQEISPRASSIVFQRPVPARFRSLEERRLARREEMKKKHQKHHKKKHRKRPNAEDSGDDDPDSGDVDEPGEDDETDESGRDDLDDDTNSGDTNTGDTDDDDDESDSDDEKESAIAVENSRILIEYMTSFPD